MMRLAGKVYIKGLFAVATGFAQIKYIFSMLIKRRMQ
jgi:hypothetical protein